MQSKKILCALNSNESLETWDYFGIDALVCLHSRGVGLGADGKDDLSSFILVPVCGREVSEALRVWPHENGKINLRAVGISPKNYVIKVRFLLL